MQMNRFDKRELTSEKRIGCYRRDEKQAIDNGGDQVINVPFHGSYGNLLFDQRWKSKRTAIVARDNGCCVICKNAEDLQVHHRQYHFIKSANAFKMPWDYADYLMITLCKSCHQRGHSKYKIPILTI
jgi:5-methylcytosine-specific restriction endonuclease McrA